MLNKVYNALLCCMLAAIMTACGNGQMTKAIVAGGSGWKQIAIIDKEKKEVIWTHDLDQGNECNSVYAWPNGDVLYSYKQGAKMITTEGNTIWDYKVAEGEEVQFASPSSNGFYLAVCGTPAKIVELDRNGKVTREISFDVNAKSVHGQFRQISKIDDETYLVPFLSRRELVTVKSDGSFADVIKLTELVPFSAKKLKSGNYLVSGGDAHAFAELDPQGNVVKRTGESDIPGITLGYIAQIEPDEKGGMLISNWLGHGADATQPHLIELDKDGNVVWTLGDTPGVNKISASREFELDNKTVEKMIKK